MLTFDSDSIAEMNKASTYVPAELGKLLFGLMPQLSFFIQIVAERREYERREAEGRARQAAEAARKAADAMAEAARKTADAMAEDWKRVLEMRKKMKR